VRTKEQIRRNHVKTEEHIYIYNIDIHEYNTLFADRQCSSSFFRISSIGTTESVTERPVPLLMPDPLKAWVGMCNINRT
jgi:hypothetical protein